MRRTVLLLITPIAEGWGVYGILYVLLGLGLYIFHKYYANKRYAAHLEKKMNEKEEEIRQAYNELEKRVKNRTHELTAANEELQAEISRRGQIENELRKSEAKYHGLFEHILEGVYQTKPDGTILAANPALVQMLGYETEEEFCHAANARIFYIDPEERQALTHKLEEEGFLRNTEYTLRRKDGLMITVMENGRAVRDEFGNVSHYEGVITDISQRKRNEEKIKQALKEKEVMLKEIHHRVKNNLQVIISLLNLQARYITEPKTLDIFKNSQERIRAMALVHEKLYQSEDLASIDFREYTESLVNNLAGTYASRPHLINLLIEVERITLDIEIAIPLGLVINELVTNSMKHAFTNGRTGTIRVYLAGDEYKDNQEAEDGYRYTLIVADDGAGFAHDIEVREGQGKSLGLMLVNSLVKQLRGTLSLDRAGGVVYTIRF